MLSIWKSEFVSWFRGEQSCGDNGEIDNCVLVILQYTFSESGPSQYRSSSAMAPASYGSCAAGQVGRTSPKTLPWVVRMASVLAVAAITMLIVLAAQLGGSPRSQRTALEVRNKNAAKMTLLCEGHFLDTATGIPETSYSTLSHPDELEGYKEPLPEDIRAQIDAKYYDNLVGVPAASVLHHLSSTGFFCLVARPLSLLKTLVVLS